MTSSNSNDISKFLGDNDLEFHNWIDAESTSIRLTRSLSQSPADTKSRSFMLRGNWGLIWWRVGMKMKFKLMGDDGLRGIEKIKTVEEGFR